MKKQLFSMIMMCLMAMNVHAQYVDALPFPSMELYDSDVMNMYLRALAETSTKRKENYDYFSNLAIEAYANGEWYKTINYVNLALDTKYYSGVMYYIRGYAHEQLGNLKEAKKDYKMGIKYDCREAVQALESLKAKNKHK